MDAAAGQDRVVPIAVLEPDASNPLPIVLFKEGTLVLSYMAFLVRKDVHVMLTFHTCFGHRFGPPGARALAAHPLAARGLKANGAFEVQGSSWARDCFGGKGRHYAFAFKDGLFECVAEGYGVEQIDEDADVVKLMARRLYK